MSEDNTVDDNRLMTVADLSQMIQVQPSTIYAWSSMGLVPVVKLGRALRFDRSAILAWIKRRSKPGRARRRLEMTLKDPSKRKSKDVGKPTTGQAKTPDRQRRTDGRTSG